MNIPSCSIDAIENWDNKSGVVNLESTVETNDLKYSRDHKQNDCEYRSYMAKLVSGVLMREAPCE